MNYSLNVFNILKNYYNSYSALIILSTKVWLYINLNIWFAFRVIRDLYLNYK